MKRLFMLLVLATLPGACALNVEPFLNREIVGDDFNTFLAREYQRQTEVEVNVDVDWLQASRFAKKGEQALAGETVLPWVPAEWDIEESDLAELESARTVLMTRLAQGRAMTPEACARAQAYFDGWLELADGNGWGILGFGRGRPDDIAAARRAFEEMLPLCGGPEG